MERDTISQLSQESSDSREPSIFAAGDIRRRLSESFHDIRPFTHDPEDPSAAALKVSSGLTIRGVLDFKVKTIFFFPILDS